MKTIKILMCVLFVLSLSASAQTPAQTVYDPINGAQLVGMAETLISVREQGQEMVKTLETANQIRSTAKIIELIEAIEDSYCIIQDLDMYDTRARIMFRTERNCFDSFMYSICITAIKNAMSQTTMAATSTNMTLGERSNTVSQSFDAIKKSNEDLNAMKESLRKKIEAKEQMEKSMNSINSNF